MTRSRRKQHRRPNDKLSRQHFAIARMIAYVEKNPTAPLPSNWQTLAQEAEAEGFIEASPQGPTVTEKGATLLRAVRRRYAV